MFQGGSNMNPNPFYGNVYFDSCAFDGGNEQEKNASIRSRELYGESGREVEIVHSVAKEIDYPKTPQWVKGIAEDSISTIEVELTVSEREQLADIEAIIVGNGSLEKMTSDCRHIFEAQKYGRYFVTTDKRLLKKAGQICSKYNLYIVKPSEFLETIENVVVKKEDI
jgi:predicted nucleic acid-binding protein